jgi:hypothetical protein
MVVQIKETDCLFKVVDDQTGPRAIAIQPRAGGWVMWLNLKAGRTTLEEAEKLAAQLQERVLHVTAGSNDPLVWVESPGSETKQ